MTEAFDALVAVIQAGERVKSQAVAEALGVERKTVYNVLDRRGIDRHRMT